MAGAILLLSLVGGSSARGEPTPDHVEMGWPAVANFAPPEMGADAHVFDMAQDRRGLIYVALPRERSVLVYDAVRWRRIQLEKTPLSLAIDAIDRLWIGSYGDVGYVELNLPGSPYVSLKDRVGGRPVEERLFHGLELWRGQPVFLDQQGLMVWRESAGEFELYDQRAAGLHRVHDALWVRTPGLLMELTDGGLQPLEWSRGLKVEAVVPLTPERTLIVGGPHKLSLLEDSRLVPWKVGAVEALADTRVTSGAVLPDGRIALSTDRKGLILTDSEGRVETVLGEAAGLTSVILRGVFVDTLGQLWVFHRNGLSRLDTAEPVTFFGSKHYRLGKAQAVTRFEGRIYVLTVYGGFVLRPGDGVQAARFVPIEGIEARAMRGFSRIGDRLLVLGDGIHEVRGERAVEVSDAFTFLMGLLATDEPGLFIASQERRLTVLQWNSEGIETLRLTRLGFSEPYDLLVGKDGTYWIVTQMYRLFRVRFPEGLRQPAEVVAYESLEPGQQHQWLGGGELDGALAFWSPDGVFRPSAEGMKRDPKFDGIDWEQEISPHAPRTLVEDGFGGVFMVRPDGVRHYVQAASGGLREEVGGGFAMLPGLRSAAHLGDNEQVLWLGHDYGVARLDLGSKDTVTSLLSPLIHTTIRSDGGALIDGPTMTLEDASELVLQPSEGVRFEYSLPLYADEELIEYRHRLQGLDNDWSPWSFEAVKEYTRLPHGEYAFQVQTRRLRRAIGQAGERRLRVLPFWHQKLWARILGLLILVVLARLALSWRYRRLRQQTVRLEQEVAARTEQVEVEKRFVEEQARQLEESNERLREEMEATQRAVEESRELEGKLHQSQRLESLGALAGGVAHDFNNLLVGIIGGAELALLDVQPNGDQAENLQRILSAGEHAADLCRQMLAYAGRAPIVARPFDLNNIAAEMQPLLKSSTRGREIRLELGFDSTASVGDRSQICQVLLNLVINASEAVCESSGTIVVRTGCERLDLRQLGRMFNGGGLDAGEYVYLEIEDNGQGMSQETRERLFEPFFTTKFVGRGLGLSTVFGIVCRHDGAVEVESQLDQGTRIRAYFPVRQSLETEEVAELGEHQFNASGLVMVVDDEPMVARVARDVLRRADFKVEIAGGGVEGVALFKQRCDEVVLALLDLSMPGMDGAETCAELREIRPDLPVIVMSGLSRSDVLAEFTDRPPSAFLQKPFTSAQLLSTVRQVLSDSEVVRARPGLSAGEITR